MVLAVHSIYGCSEYCCRVNHPFHCGGTTDAIRLCSAPNPGKKYIFPIQGSYFVDGLKPTDCFLHFTQMCPSTLPETNIAPENRPLEK